MNSAISTIRRLPNELWGQIFAFGSESSNNIDSDLNRPPWTFGQVCSRWRMIALATPTLWCSLSARMTEETWLVASEGTRALMKEWLARSYPCPIDFSLASSIGGRGGIILEQVFLPYADRVRTLTLSLSLSHLKPLLKLPSTMPLIEVLELGTPMHGPNRWSAPAISFKKSPRLHTVVFRSAEILDRNLVVLPWNQLTELVLEHKHPVDDILRLISIATNLREFRIGAWCTELLGISVNPNIIIHQNLRDFSTIIINNHRREMFPDIASLFFHRLKLPALQYADLDAWGPHELQSIADLQFRSGFSLENLSLSVKGLSSYNYLLKILEGAPALVKLQLHIDDNAQDCIKVLRYISEDQGRLVAPCIEELHLALRYATNGYEVLNIVKLRWWSGHDNTRFGVTRLIRLSVDMLDPLVMAPAVVEQLREFENEGLVLKIKEIKSSRSS